MNRGRSRRVAKIANRRSVTVDQPSAGDVVPASISEAIFDSNVSKTIEATSQRIGTPNRRASNRKCAYKSEDNVTANSPSESTMGVPPELEPT
jgi:hypothetical protein